MHRLIPCLLLCAAASAQAQTTVALDLVDATGTTRPVGTVALAESPHGLVLTPALQGLPPGLHGFHVHDKGSCAPSAQGVPAGAAGGHYDPQGTGRHDTPWGDGHLGDLPALYVDGEGRAAMPVLAPRLKLADVAGRALMVHAGGDNHADHPAPLGGGGARVACGVIGGTR
ncbi:superoxide dismutase [Cu-Zn] SodC [Acidovorax sp. SDU_ACID1]|uniref:superoxide dismutase [Cu-Zn] SodC n=1 Tax=Acidovorax sp. SDU_ACID1 TaxID=3136632 RepID=UPI003872EAE1